jgi:uncharacterized protein
MERGTGARRYSVYVKLRCSKPNVVQMDDGTLVVSVSAAPVDGKANAAVIRALATYFGVARSKVRIVSGETGRKKLIEVD